MDNKDQMPPEGTSEEHAAAMSEEEYEEVEEAKFRKAKRKHRNKDPEIGELNLTAMMDMMTIMLVYLLKSYNTSPAVNVSGDIAPPVSSSRLEMKEATSIAISKNGILVDGKPVVQIVDGKFRPEDISGTGAAKLVTPLMDALNVEVEKVKMMHERGLGPEFEGKVLILGDRRIPYEILSSVLFTAGQAQLANFHFVVLSSSS